MEVNFGGLVEGAGWESGFDGAGGEWGEGGGGFPVTAVEFQRGTGFSAIVGDPVQCLMAEAAIDDFEQIDGEIVEALGDAGLGFIGEREDRDVQ